jgi:anti-anti-sigma factor
MDGAPSLRLERLTDRRGFRVSGEVDASNAHFLSAALVKDVQEGGEIYLDLSAVAFMDSTGIGVLLQTGGDLVGRGKLVLQSPSQLVRNVLTLIRADMMPGLEISNQGG